MHRNETNIFSFGDQVTPLYTEGYLGLTMGTVYTVVEYEPPVAEPGGFRFPAYVSVIDNLGRRIWAHARRFKGA